jgi:hypothetical protein
MNYGKSQTNNNRRRKGREKVEKKGIHDRFHQWETKANPTTAYH